MRTLVAVMSLALALGCECGGPRPVCDTPDACTLVAAGDDAGPLAHCLIGAWRNYGDGGSCAPIPCRPDAGPPECAQPDCGKHAYSVYLPDAVDGTSGTVFQGSFVLSASAASWSAVIPPERFSYAASGATIVTDGGSGPRSADATCTAQQLVIGGAALKLRAAPDEAASLEALMRDGGVWTGRTYP